jgi:hypothetical protein
MLTVGKGGALRLAIGLSYLIFFLPPDMLLVNIQMGFFLFSGLPLAGTYRSTASLGYFHGDTKKSGKSDG